MPIPAGIYRVLVGLVGLSFILVGAWTIRGGDWGGVVPLLIGIGLGLPALAWPVPPRVRRLQLGIAVGVGVILAVRLAQLFI